MWGMIPLNWNKGVWKVVERYKIVYQGGTGELVEKKSRFIADIKPVAVRKMRWPLWRRCEGNTGMQGITALPIS